MNKEVMLILQMCYLGLFARLLYLWADGIVNRQSAVEGAKILLVLMLGTTVAAYVTTSTGKQLEEYKGLICDKRALNVWMCGGWPIFWDGYAKILSNLRSPLLSFMSLPALAAPLIANLYMARKIAEARHLESWELFRILGASFIVYFVLTHSPWLLQSSEAVMRVMEGNADTAAEGQASMVQWVKSINQYIEIWSQLGYSEKPYAAAIPLFLLAAMISIGSTMVYLYQLSLVAMMPKHFFDGLIQDKASLMLGFRKLFAVAAIGLWNGPIWLAFSVLPKLAPPELIGGTLAYSDSAYYSIVGAAWAGCFIFFGYYVGIFVLGVKGIVSGFFK
jgi:hypothetical protein